MLDGSEICAELRSAMLDIAVSDEGIKPSNYKAMSKTSEVETPAMTRIEVSLILDLTDYDVRLLSCSRLEGGNLETHGHMQEQSSKRRMLIAASSVQGGVKLRV